MTNFDGIYTNAWTGNTNTMSAFTYLSTCTSCGMSYDPNMGHACPSSYTTITTTNVSVKCLDCGQLYNTADIHICPTSVRTPLLGLEQRYIHNLKDIV